MYLCAAVRGLTEGGVVDDQIAELHERGVLLAVDRDALHELQRSSRRARDEQRESPLQAALRKAWDWLAGVR